jgi:hypothetical protein
MSASPGVGELFRNNRGAHDFALQHFASVTLGTTPSVLPGFGVVVPLCCVPSMHRRGCPGRVFGHRVARSPEPAAVLALAVSLKGAAGPHAKAQSRKGPATREKRRYVAQQCHGSPRPAPIRRGPRATMHTFTITALAARVQRMIEPFLGFSLPAGNDQLGMPPRLDKELRQKRGRGRGRDPCRVPRRDLLTYCWISRC